jgi:hypothetical protein
MVAASDRASIPEAGGNFCAYYDPENVHEAYQVISGLITHPERIAIMERAIATSFRPATWADTAAALINALVPEQVAPLAPAPAALSYPVDAD